MGQPLEMLKMQEKKEIRCGHCNRLLGKGTARDLEIKCPRCGTLNHVRDFSPCSEPFDGLNGAFYVDSEKKNRKLKPSSLWAHIASLSRVRLS